MTIGIVCGETGHEGRQSGCEDGDIPHDELERAGERIRSWKKGGNGVVGELLLFEQGWAISGSRWILCRPPTGKGQENKRTSLKRKRTSRPFLQYCSKDVESALRTCALSLRVCYQNTIRNLLDRVIEPIQIFYIIHTYTDTSYHILCSSSSKL